MCAPFSITDICTWSTGRTPRAGMDDDVYDDIRLLGLVCAYIICCCKYICRAAASTFWRIELPCCCSVCCCCNRVLYCCCCCRRYICSASTNANVGWGTPFSVCCSSCGGSWIATAFIASCTGGTGGAGGAGAAWCKTRGDGGASDKLMVKTGRGLFSRLGGASPLRVSLTTFIGVGVWRSGCGGLRARAVKSSTCFLTVPAPGVPGVES
mmetsp:Transcript_62909/g.92243  ORF Transcript_62909/g.92243 Transcript_62909/m.92243 type:complete len:210 (+) Transcript_62909:552-1181(+)